MRFARIGLFVLSISAVLSLAAFAQSTPSSTTTSATQTTTGGTNAPPSGPQSPPNPAPTPTPPPVGPMQIKVGPDTSIRFGLLLQPQIDLAENAAGQTSQNVLVRRVRFIVSGQATKKAFFFFQTENSRLGNSSGTTKTISSGFQALDAVVEYRFMRQFNLWGGMIYVPTSREALKSSSSQFFIDQHTYAYTSTGALGGTAGRDTGFMARGYFVGDRLEYRAGFFSGFRNPAGARNAFRKVARLQWEFLDTEPYTLPAYPGSYYGSKRVAAVGAAYDAQGTYKAPSADFFFDVPTGFGSALGTVSWMRLDPGTLAPTVTTAVGGGRSNIFVVDAGAFLKTVHKLGPWLRYENQKFDSPNQGKSVKRYIGGINWFPYLNNFNIKTAIIDNKPQVGKSFNEYIVQMQFFIY